MALVVNKVPIDNVSLNKNPLEHNKDIEEEFTFEGI